MKVAVLISNYNRGDLLERSLWLLGKQTHHCQVFIADCGSEDHWEEIAKEYGAIYEQIKKPEDQRSGPYFGWLWGYERADADFIILSHPEVMVPINAIELMLKEYEEGRRIAAQPFCLGPYPQIKIDKANWQEDLIHLRELPGFWDYQNYWGYTNYEAEHHYEQFIFTGMMEEDWERIGFLPGHPDSEYFLGYEDWLAPIERATDRNCVKASFPVYHQFHSWDRIGMPSGKEDFVKIPQSVRIQRIQGDTMTQEEKELWDYLQKRS